MEATTYLLLARITGIIHGVIDLYLFSFIIAFFFLNGKYRLRYYMPGIIMLAVQVLYIFVSSLISSFQGYKCCLAELELYLLNHAGRGQYNSGFTVHYLEKIGINISEILVNFCIGAILAIAICTTIIFFLRRKQNKASP